VLKEIPMETVKTHVRMDEADDETVRKIVVQVLMTVQLIADDCDTGKLGPILDRLLKEKEFELWPLSGRQQPAYIQRLTERALEELQRPVTQETDVAGSYVDPNIVLPDLDPGPAAAPGLTVADEPEEPAEDADPFHQGRPDTHGA
jgi:hypothetical protein